MFKKFGNIKTFKKAVNPKMLASVWSGRISDIVYIIEYEKGFVRATFEIDKKNGALSIYT